MAYKVDHFMSALSDRKLLEKYPKNHNTYKAQCSFLLHTDGVGGDLQSMSVTGRGLCLMIGSNWEVGEYLTEYC